MVTEHLRIESSHSGWAHIGLRSYRKQLWLRARCQAILSTGTVRFGDASDPEHIRACILSDSERRLSGLAGTLLDIRLQLENLRGGNQIRQKICTQRPSGLTAIFFSSPFA